VSDTESFEHAMAEMRKVVMDDCYMTRCSMYDDDCYQCQQDILDRMQRAHERELEHVRKAEFARGYDDGQRSMDAEHYAVALRLRGLRFDGGSHDNLSRIAYAIYPCATGWTCESSEGLRDRLIDLLGGVHKPDVALPTYDVLGNERHKAVCRLREIQTDAGGFVKALANALGVEWQAPRVHQTIAEVRDRLIHLLDGDTELNSQKSPILANSDGEDGCEVTITDELRKFKGHINAGLTPEMVLALRAQINWIADRIDEQLKTVHQNDYDEWQLQTDKMRAMLTEQRDEARAKVLRLESENAEWRRGAERDTDKLESLTGVYNDAVAERDELRKKLEELEKFDPDIAMAAYEDDNEELRRLLYRAAKLLANAEQDRDANYAYWMDCKEKVVQKSVTIDELSKELEDARDAMNEATGRWARADEERRELQAKLDAIREAVDAL